MTELIFCNWDNRPAVLTEFSAFAVLGRGEPWTKVSRHDVFGTAGLMSEDAWRRMFVRKFGHLDVVRWRPMVQDNVPQSKPLPRAKDFDRVAREARAMAKEAPSKKTYDLYNSPDAREDRVMLAMLRRLVARKEAARLEHATNLAHQIATAPLRLLPEIASPPTAP
jgi:hypothetical protein